MGIIHANASSTHCYKSNNHILIDNTPRVNAATTHTFLCRWKEMGTEGGLKFVCKFIIILIDRFTITCISTLHIQFTFSWFSILMIWSKLVV